MPSHFCLLAPETSVWLEVTSECPCEIPFTGEDINHTALSCLLGSFFPLFRIMELQNALGWKGPKKSSCYNSFLWAGTSSTGPGVSKPHPKCPWTFQGWGSPWGSQQFLWATWASVSAPSHRRVSSIKIQILLHRGIKSCSLSAFPRPDSLLIISLHLAQMFHANCALEVLQNKL